MRLLRPALAAALVAAFASPARAQDERWREVLAGEPATIVFGPQGGYARENYLKRFKAKAGQEQWATQNGVLAELIRRTTPGGKVRLAAFRCDEPEVMNALFEAAKTRNVEVKLWLKGPPGLTYMVAAHEAIAERANQYLRERAAQHKEAEWGDVQVMIGTEAQMDAFGKINDMHEKFGVLDLSPVHAPGRNHAFLGTSNIGASSDRSHNESRLFFHDNPHAAQRLWQEFDRLWRHLGECRTFQGGDASKGPNATPEGEARIRVGGGFADERPQDGLAFRFTYEKDGNGQFHRISRDFVDAIGEATQLPAGAVVWVAQFGFQVSTITEALVRAARAAPQVEFRVMVHMAEAEAGGVQRLVDARLPNLKVGCKWDSTKLVLAEGERPRIPDHDLPGPPLLHHKTLVVGERLMITGSFNFFPDADDQGENIAILRAHVAPVWGRVLADTRAEFEALWRAQVLLDAATIHGPDGLLEQVEALSAKDGFLEALSAVGAEPKTAEQVRAALGQGAPSLDTVKGWLDALARFRFVTRDPAGRYAKVDPDAATHAPKEGVRTRALQNGPGPVEPPPPPTPPPPPPGPTDGTVTGRVVVDGAAVRLVAGATTYRVTGPAVVKALAALAGRTVEVAGTITPGQAGAASLAATRLVAPVRGETRATVVAGPGGGVKLRLQGATTLVDVAGPAAGVLARAVGRDVVVDGYALPDAVVALAVQATVTRRGTLTATAWGQPVATLPRGERVWVTKLHTTGSLASVLRGDRRGWFQTSRLAIGSVTTGLVDTVPGQ